MPLYQIEKTAQKGQVLFVATDKRGLCPIVSLQMPEKRARQILAAFKLAEKLIENPCVGNGENRTADYAEAQRLARLLLDMPIEKS